MGAVSGSQKPWWIFFGTRFLASVATVSLNVLLRRRGFVALPSGFVISVTSTSVGSLFGFFHHVMFQAEDPPQALLFVALFLHIVFFMLVVARTL